MNLKLQCFDDSFTPDSRNGLSMGAFVAYSHLSWMFQTELNLISKGAQSDDWKYHLNYVEMPILVKIPIRPHRHIKPNLILGFAPSYLIRSTVTEGNKAGTCNYYSGELESFDISLITGLGFDVLFKNSFLFIEVRYSYGMMTTFSSDSNYLEEKINAPRFNNHTVIFKIGYGLKL
jgi:hypothetical protein